MKILEKATGPYVLYKLPESVGDYGLFTLESVIHTRIPAKQGRLWVLRVQPSLLVDGSGAWLIGAI